MLRTLTKTYLLILNLYLFSASSSLILQDFPKVYNADFLFANCFWLLGLILIIIYFCRQLTLLPLVTIIIEDTDISAMIILLLLALMKMTY